METEKQANARRHHARRARFRERSTAHLELMLCHACGGRRASSSFRNCDRCREVSREWRADALARGLCSSYGGFKPSEAGGWCPGCFEKRLRARRSKRAAAGRRVLRGPLLLDNGLEHLASELHRREFTTFERAIGPFPGSLRRVLTFPIIITRRPEYWAQAVSALQFGSVDVAELGDDEIPAALDWYWARLRLQRRSSFLLTAKQGYGYCMAGLAHAG